MSVRKGVNPHGVNHKGLLDAHAVLSATLLGVTVLQAKHSSCGAMMQLVHTHLHGFAG